jgi:putative Holliday junction resolvase
MTPGRVLALDLGERRIGVALSDSSRLLATPYCIVERPAGTPIDTGRIRELVEATGATLIVVGLPLSLNGSRGPAAERIAAETATLAANVPVPVEQFDERFSTAEAARRRLERRGGRAGRKSQRAIDGEAAAVFLAAYLDARRARTQRAETSGGTG